jgi:hypothetical protein
MSWLQNRLHELRSVPDKEMMFTAHDIPFYHFFPYPELAIFRIYAWHHTSDCNIESFCRFLNSSANDKIVSLYDKIHSDYIHIPVKEVWTKQTIDTTLRLLEYYCDTDAFAVKDVLLVLTDQLSRLIETVKQYASDGYKEGEDKTPFALYVCSVDVENSFMMLRNGESWTCTMKLYAINRMETGNDFLCAQTLKWIESLMSKSILVSGNTAHKERLLFFETMQTRIQCLKNRISAK